MNLIPYTSFRLKTELSAQQIEEKLTAATGDLDNLGTLDHLAANTFNTSFGDHEFLLKKTPPNRWKTTPVGRVKITETSAYTVLQINIRNSWLSIILNLLFLGYFLYQIVKLVIGIATEPSLGWAAFAVAFFFIVFVGLAFLISESLFALYVQDYRRFLEKEIQAKKLIS
ncbi:hypothetical protein HHL16_06070 [Pseudoflavitalea sp. G-6-1-2]|uniref:hypothetical protein n=1 Tax=Pseudoflavitalea sp. G-6-1-2 TaxID=2728841 RepID=UPI00146C52C8|nr:hypothetical protein [Pseudoflavitalea sp. G-6-1-2]NML20430.1 hypothetical protein [Pseudoflavitalea sp. G-6-1-2]